MYNVLLYDTFVIYEHSYAQWAIQRNKLKVHNVISHFPRYFTGSWYWIVLYSVLIVVIPVIPWWAVAFSSFNRLNNSLHPAVNELPAYFSRLWRHLTLSRLRGRNLISLCTFKTVDPQMHITCSIKLSSTDWNTPEEIFVYETLLHQYPRSISEFHIAQVIWHGIRTYS